MNLHQSRLSLWLIGITIFANSVARGQDAGYAELKGSWQAVELVDNGRVIPADAIPGWLPSGGRIEIVDNSIVFTSPKDGQRHARVFSLDATTYPRQLNVIDGGKITGQGIYRIDGGRLVICLTPPAATSRPTEFMRAMDRSASCSSLRAPIRKLAHRQPHRRSRYPQRRC